MDVVTRLNTYKNMLIESIEVSDDVSTLCALKATINMVQVLVVNVGTEKVSAREYTSGAEKAPVDKQPLSRPPTMARQAEIAAGIGVK